MNKVREFRLYWLTGETEDVQGPDLGDTFKTLASIILNDSLVVALRDLDYWEEITEVKDE